ncbi:unconventional myosin-VI-like [Dysidea avara]|uniref:unconventional myosin-VI-like n=1 Tax=Dysidea avara TaxID=196820 RepID=UPI00331EDE19
MKTSDIMDLLDEECKLPKGSPDHFTDTVHSTHRGHFRLTVPCKSKLNYHRNLRDDEGFMIRHFAGAVCYQTAAFLEKNNDALHDSLGQLMVQSTDPFVKKLFPASGTKKETNSKKLTLISIGRKFKKQLNELMEKLRQTGSSFIRCLKPNLKMEPHHFIGGQILSQLQCAGMVSVLELMEGGFLSRAQFSDLYQMYQKYLPKKLAQLDPRLFCKALFRALGLSEHEYQFGMSKVFFRAGKFAEFDQIMKSDPEHLAVLVQKVQRWLICIRWKKGIFGVISVLKLSRKISYRVENAVVIQKNVRMFLAKRKYQPRYRGIGTIKTLRGRIEQLNSMVTVLKKKDPLQKNIVSIEGTMDSAVKKIKETMISGKEIEAIYNDILQSCEGLMGEMKQQQEKERREEEEAEHLRKLKEEEERLRRIQEEMERERKRKEEEERRRKQEEEERRIKAEMEERCRREEEERKRREEEERLKREREAEAERKRREQEEKDRELQQKIEAEAEAARLAAEEQERRDYELAMRLAQDEQHPQQVIVEHAVQKSQSRIARRSLKRSEAYAGKQQQTTKKHDLSKWKFPELRDTINTSCDLELLEACRDEFHRRLRVYHAWKAKNKKRTESPDEMQRAPAQIVQQAEQNQAKPLPTPPKRISSLIKDDDTPQRFFRVAFTRPGQQRSLDQRKGWWYAHFDGQYIARQLELYPDKQPLFLLAGKDDLEMCELTLEETGLARKQGAEILEHEFELEWTKHGGVPYIRPFTKAGR